MAKANVLLISHIFIQAAAKMYPDATQPLCLTVWFKKKKEKKRRKETECKGETSSCTNTGKKARRKLREYYKNTKLLFPVSLTCHGSQVLKAGKQRYGNHNECLARVLSVNNKCHREAAAFSIFSGSRFLSL